MASGIANAVIGKVSGMAVEEVVQEASLVWNFKKDFQWVRSKLTHVRGYLEDADGKSAENASVRRWVQDMQDVLFDAEDIVEECAVEPLYRSGNQSCLCSYRRLSFQYKLGRRIRDLKERLKTVMENARDLQLVCKVSRLDEASTSTSYNRGEEWKRSSYVESNAKPIAVEPKVQEILRLLEDRAHQVIAVLGMGGIGKTFLVQNVFQQAEQRFDTKIWLSISQFYTISKLQSDIASCINLKDEVKNVSEQQAGQLIHNRLAGKRALIVLDDVWRVDLGISMTEKLGIPLGDSQIKVIVTTRNTDVCQQMKAFIYKMELLSDQDSWYLFCAYAFPKSRPPQHLETVSRDVEKECGKLPLAIKTIAASMTQKTDKREWEVMLRQLKEVSDKNSQDTVMPILQLSYNSLPTDIKPCFLYFSFFEEDKKINVYDLIECWIAEGFIPQGEKEWNTGLDYLFRLRDLCLAEVWEEEQRFRSETLYEMNTYCRIHDLLLDLAIKLGKENKCAFQASTEYPPGCRRILLAKKGLNDDGIASSTLQCPPFLRTLSLSGNNIQNIPTALLSSTRLLRVIDLSHTQISTLPACIGNLRLVRVLNLFGTAVYDMPECVRNLKSLHCLYIPVRRLPAWIAELECLRDLYVDRNCYLPKEISKLRLLCRLRRFWGGKEYSLSLSDEGDDGLKLKDVAKLTHLKQLWLHLSHEVEMEQITRGILAQLTDMRYLAIQQTSPHNPKISDNMNAMTELQMLSLMRFDVTECICRFTNLRMLWLKICNCSDDSALETLPNLEKLRLWWNHSCRELPQAFGKPGGFPKLQSLYIWGFNLLEELPELKNGAMESLKVLELANCDRLRKIPKGLEQLKSLELLLCQGLENGLTVRLKEGGEDWAKIKAHNPLIQIALK